MNTSESTNKYQLPPLGLDFLSVSGAHPVDHIEAAAASGFTSVGLRLAAPLGLTLMHDIVKQPELLRDTLVALEETGIQVLDVEAFTLDDKTNVTDFEHAFAITAELGANIVQAVVEDSEINRAQNRFGQMCELARQYNLVVAIEFMKWRSLKSLADAWQFISSSNQNNGKLCIDCLHLSRCGDSPEDVGVLPVGSIAYVQLCDALASLPPLEEYLQEARGGRLYPGEGDLWLQELLDILPADVPLSIEVPREIDVGKSVAERAMQAASAMGRFFRKRALR